jgi:single-strand DNA-binding protein
MSNRGLNKVFLIGNLTRNPETRYTKEGKQVTTFQLAVNLPAKGGQEKTEFIRCVAWEKLAEIVTAHLVKGAQVYLEGRLQTRSWAEPDGTRRYMTEVIVSELVMLGGNPPAAGPSADDQLGDLEDDGEGIPF